MALSTEQARKVVEAALKRAQAGLPSLLQQAKQRNEKNTPPKQPG